MLDVHTRPVTDDDLARYAERHADRSSGFLGVLGCAIVSGLFVAILVALVAWLGGLLVVWLRPGTTLGIIPPVIGLVAGALFSLAVLLIGYSATREPRIDWTEKPPRDVLVVHADIDAAWCFHDDDLDSLLVLRSTSGTLVLVDASAFDGFGDDGADHAQVREIGSRIHVEWMGIGELRTTILAHAKGDMVPIVHITQSSPDADWLRKQQTGDLNPDDLPRDLRTLFAADRPDADQDS